MIDTEYLLDLIDEKESLFAIPYISDFKFDIWMHEYSYLWTLEISYFFKKIENKDIRFFPCRRTYFRSKKVKDQIRYFCKIHKSL